MGERETHRADSACSCRGFYTGKGGREGREKGAQSSLVGRESDRKRRGRRERKQVGFHLLKEEAQHMYTETMQQVLGMHAGVRHSAKSPRGGPDIPECQYSSLLVIIKR